jgi:GNAT superfamily N-acetyltransferase
LQIITYDQKFKTEFRTLNLRWIETYFRVEAKDLEQVNNPEVCLADGGEIFFVIEDDVAVGVCAIYKTGPRKYELAKMAVHPDHQGKKYGGALMVAAESWARMQGAEEILILSNTVLAPAIGLYKKHGFLTTHLGPHPDYERCNIEMKKSL